jgi:hypothetical protein
LDKADNCSWVYNVLGFALQQFNGELSHSYAVDYIFVSATNMTFLIEAQNFKGQDQILGDYRES